MTNRRRKPWPIAAEWARRDSLLLLEENARLWREHERCLNEARKEIDRGNLDRAQMCLSEARRIATEVERNGALIRLKLTEAGIGQEPQV